MSPLARLFRSDVRPQDSVIAAGTTITGTVRGGRGRLLVEGTLHGDASAGAIIVAPGGVIEGDTSADVLHVAGRVEGAAQVGQLQVAEGGCFRGDALYESLEVAPGAGFEATCRALPKAAPAPAKPTPAVAPAPAAAVTGAVVAAPVR